MPATSELPPSLEPLARSVVRALGAMPRGLQGRLGGAPIEIDGQRLDPEVQVSLRLLALAGEPPRAQAVEAARARLEADASLFRGRRLPAAVRDLSVAGAAGPLRARLYAPPPGSRVGRGLVVYYHGGGWTTGSIESHDQTCRFLAREGSVRLLSVDYRLAPEHPFPAAAEDALASFRWAVAHAAELGADPERVALCGDSAGGNLAAVTALESFADAIPAAMQALIYPVCDPSRKYPSRSLFAEGFFLTDAQMSWYEQNYLPDPETRADPRAAPLRAADLAGAPPAYIAVAGFDPLRDEGLAYAERLREAGVPVELRLHRGLVHGFAGAAGLGRGCPAAVREIAAAIRAGLDRGG